MKIGARAFQYSAMSDSRAFVDSKCTLELYSVQQNSIVRVTRVQVTEGRIEYFAASGSDVAILYADRWVCLYRLSGYRLTERARIRLNARGGFTSVDVWLIARR